jgi:hypothetical protein
MVIQIIPQLLIQVMMKKKSNEKRETFPPLQSNNEAAFWVKAN